MGFFGYFGYILLAIGLLMLMITIHELGHYLAGKILKFKINEFAIGMGPKLFSKKKKSGEVFSIRAIPLGGYCAFEGEDDADEPADSSAAPTDDGKEAFKSDSTKDGDNETSHADALPQQKSGIVRLAGSITGTAGKDKHAANSGLKSFNDQKPWKRIIVLLSGGLFNLISAVLFSFIFICAVGMPQPQVAMLLADEYGDPYVTQLNTGDVITHADGRSMDIDYMFSGTLTSPSDKEVVLTVLRAESDKTEEIKLKRQEVVRREDASAKNKNILRDDDGNIIYMDVFDDDGNIIFKEVVSKGNNSSVIYKVITDENGEIISKSVKDKDGGTYYLVTDEYKTGENGKLIFNYMTDKDGNLISKLATDKDGKLVYDPLFGLSFSSYFGEGGKGFTTALKRSVPLTGKMSWLVLSTLGKLLTGQMSCTAVSGPVGTIAGIAEGAAMGGWQFILIMMPLIAANLGIFNLLPIPALDGSKIIFCIIEWIRKKPVNRKVENMIHAVGLLVLFGLVILVDITGLFARCGL